MGHHRADAPAEARPRSETHKTPGRRAADVPVDSPSTTTSLRVEDIQAEAQRQAQTLRQAERASYVGRRRAPVPASPEIDAHEAELVSDGNVARVLEALVPTDHTTAFDNEDTARLTIDRSAPEPVTTTYVATSTPGQPALAGKRRARKHTGTRGPLFKSLPSAPVLVGIAALALSIGGAVTVNDQAPVSTAAANGVVHASALSGSGGTGKVSDRDAIVSRDGADRAKADAAGADELPEEVTALAEQRAGAIGNLAKKAEKHAAFLALDLWQYPLEPVVLTARFGEYGLWSSYHTGLDFNGDTGDQIHAIANGVVTFAGYDGSYGNKTVVTLDDGTEVWYCHQTTQYVTVGDVVSGGDIIGTVGSTGHVTGSHLHVEVRPGGGDPVDPYAAMQQHGLF